jgi:hypothetical protein
LPTACQGATDVAIEPEARAVLDRLYSPRESVNGAFTAEFRRTTKDADPGDLPGDRQMSKIASCVVLGAIMLVCGYAAVADELASFATGGYASGLRTKDMMHKIDTNNDGMISRDEWIAFQDKVFAMLDKKNNGKVDKTEYAHANPEIVSLATGGYASGLLTDEMFKKIDTNADGVISHDEFIGYQLKIFHMMDTSSVHKGMLGQGEFFATGGKPAP